MPRRRQQYCRNGHELKDPNLVWSGTGTRACRICKNAYEKQRKRELRRGLRKSKAMVPDEELDRRALAMELR